MRLLTATATSLFLLCAAAQVPALAADRPAAATAGPNLDSGILAPAIADAPADDYERVAWCHGILSGNMDLAKQVDAVFPTDETLLTIGRSYLRAYEAALTLSGKGKTEAGHALAEQARQRGYDGWKAARESSDPMKAAGAHATWQLPGDCEHAAIRLSGHPNLFGEMATETELDAIAMVMTSGGPRDYDELPKPALTAQTVDEADPDAPIATNTIGRRVNQSKGLPKLPADKPAS